MAKPITRYRAVLFDLDGVLVPTTILHMHAWQETFDETLPDGVAPYTQDDYYKYVDGKPRYDGVLSVLQSRGITLPMGEITDPGDAHTVCGIGNRKNDKFEQILEREGIEPYPDTVDVLRHLRAAGTRLAVVSSSRNAAEVLKIARINQFFTVIVDGNTRRYEGLRGKPAPDTYTFAAKRLGVENQDAVVVEDALSGVAAGKAGNFGLVIGVDRGAGRQALYNIGANVVIRDLVQIIEGTSDRSTIHWVEPNKDPLDPAQYPIEPWGFSELENIDSTSATLFSVANGNIGIRGGGDATRALGSGTFLNGFHETFPIHADETAYGLASIGQAIQGVPDASDFRFIVNGTKLEAPIDWSQRIDFRTGRQTEERTYVLEHGDRLRIEISRTASQFDANLAIFTLTVTSMDTDLQVEVDATLNAQQSAPVRTNDPRKGEVPEDGGLVAVPVSVPDEDLGACECQAYRCYNSRMTMAVGVRQTIDGAITTGTSWILDAKQGVPVSAIRYAAYHSYSLNPRGAINGLAVVGEQNADELVRRCVDTLNHAYDVGLDELMNRQTRTLNEFWSASDVEVEPGDNGRIQQTVRWELYQLAQSTMLIRNGVPAKGLSGSGYSGHYFWDSETFVLPFLSWTRPHSARLALNYRYRMLTAARKRAAAMNVDGALYPWRTINGEEASAYFPAGTAQYHIDADIAYALIEYLKLSGDDDFLAGKGIDILVETARMWFDLGSYARDGFFHIYGVTGPDEYTAMVDDNFYTNAMAKFNLLTAVNELAHLWQVDPDSAAAAVDRLNIRDDELEEFSRAANAMALPVDERTGIHSQDAQFLSRPMWDFTHKTARPLLLYYHPLVIYRHQILKQVDVVMVLHLLSSWFTLEQKRSDFDYYDPITTGDSTLSAACQAIVAAEVGHEHKALEYFTQALYTDVADLHANTKDGVHLAAAGGVWSALVYGFGGLHDTGGDDIDISPRLPSNWQSMRYNLTLRGTRLAVTLTHEHEPDIQRISGEPVTISVQGEPRTY